MNVGRPGTYIEKEGISWHTETMSFGLMTVVGSVCLAAGTSYALFHVTLTAGLFRLRRRGQIPSVKVSVIVAARNEAGSVKGLLDALLHQSRLPEEIVVVDDRSTDETFSIVTSYRAQFPVIVPIRVAEVPDGVSPKKHALSTGIAASSGDILFFTDADCQPPPGWIAGLLGMFDEYTGVVVGTYLPSLSPPNSTQQRGVLPAFVSYEKFKSTVLCAGSLGLGFPWMASGSSLAYRREVYDAVGGFTAFLESQSGDYDLFVQRVRRMTHWSVAFSGSVDTAVLTTAPANVTDFLRQRMRHFSAGRKYAKDVQIALVLYHASNLVATAGLFAYFLGLATVSALEAYAIKICADIILLAFGGHILERHRAWSLVIPMEFLYVLYTTLVGPLGVISRVAWKPGSSA